MKFNEHQRELINAIACEVKEQVISMGCAMVELDIELEEPILLEMKEIDLEHYIKSIHGSVSVISKCLGGLSLFQNEDKEND